MNEPETIIEQPALEKPEQTTPLIIWVTKTPMTLWRIEGKGKAEKRINVTNRYERGWLDSERFRWHVPDGQYFCELGWGDEKLSIWSEVKDGKVKQSNELDKDELPVSVETQTKKKMITNHKNK